MGGTQTAGHAEEIEAPLQVLLGPGAGEPSAGAQDTPMYSLGQSGSGWPDPKGFWHAHFQD